MGLFSSKKSSPSNNADALFEAAEQAYNRKNYVKAADLYRKAANLGHARSMSFLAYAYRFGEGVREDHEEALRLYKKSYANGIRKDAGNIGAMYHFGEVSGASEDEITELLKEGAALECKNAYVPLAERYYFSKYGCENAKLAAYWAYRAFCADQTFGSYYMGLFCYDGTFFSVSPAYAKYYFENFLSRGGDRSYVEEYLEDDKLKNVNGIKPYKKPFEDNLPADFFDRGDPEALLMQGSELVHGHDADNNPTPRDIEKGMVLIRDAAEQGCALAQSVYGMFFEETDKQCPIFSENGNLDIYKSDVDRYLHWLTKAADAGEETALDTLIIAFTNGKGSIKPNRILADMYGDMRLKITGEAFIAPKKNTARNGYDVIEFDNGDVYEGNFVDGEYHGQGKYTSHKGWSYEGDFVFGKSRGKGTVTVPGSYTYTGDVRNYKADGFGTRKNSDGTTESGMWRDGLPHGLGSREFANGDKYYGEMRDGHFVGVGVYLSANGKIMAGEFNDGCVSYDEIMKYNAAFKVRTSDRTKYYGQLAPAVINGQTVDCPNGRGERCTDGGYELGIFKNSNLILGASFFGDILRFGDFDSKGRLNGEGTVLFINDFGLVSYKGEFFENRFHGKGIYTRSDGQSFLAVWENGEHVRTERVWAANGTEIRDFVYTGCKEDEGFVLTLS